MPEGYRHAVADNPFYIVENRLGQPVATGYLDIESLSVEAIFTLPEWGGQGCADLIMRAVIAEARRRGLETITLEATPMRRAFIYAMALFHMVKRVIIRKWPTPSYAV